MLEDELDETVVCGAELLEMEVKVCAWIWPSAISLTGSSEVELRWVSGLGVAADSMVPVEEGSDEFPAA